MSETPDETPVTIEIRRGSATEEELAAVVAVVSEAYSTEVATLEADDGPRPSAWMQNRRGLRAPLRRDLGWSGFRG